MLERTRGDLLLRAAAELGFRDSRPLPARELLAQWARTYAVESAIEGTLDIEQRATRLRLGLSHDFPSALPHIFLADPKALGFLPHVDKHGWVCYQTGEGLVLRTDDPDAILHEAATRAIAIVADGVAGRNWRAVFEELEAYWAQHSAGGSVACHVDPTDRLREIVAAERERHWVYVADSFEAVAAFRGAPAKPSTQRRAVYVPLVRGVLEEQIDLSRFHDPIWTDAFVQRHLSRTDQSGWDGWQGSKPPALVVLGVPRPSGERSLVGYARLSDRRQELVTFDRRDRAYLRTRGGARTELAGKLVAIIGCGAVGGHLALALAHAGVERFVLVDPDRFKTENLYRHVLGLADLGKPKVTALKQAMMEQLPFLKVDEIVGPAQLAIEDGRLKLASVDLIIVAVGTPAVSLQLNEIVLSAALPPGLLTWLEPLGLGGHALVTHVDARARGCYRCLFTNKNGDLQLENRADFAAPGQIFARDLTGCASPFTPFGDLDARRTAEVAARLSINVLLKKTIHHGLTSWKGDASAFRDAGYLTAPRFEFEQAVLDERSLDYVQAACRLCVPR